MNAKTWQEFSETRKKYKKIVERINKDLPKLKDWQQKLVEKRSGPSYKIETPVVYNSALDEIKPGDNIKLILVADNPGRREQAAENRRYLVGPSGKIAARFFLEHPELGIDFNKHVLILNKTPIHTPRTVELAEICRLGNDTLEKILNKSQEDMVMLLTAFHRCFAPVPVWIIGYSEMKKGGLFEMYTHCLQAAYSRLPKRRKELFFFRHFSMNQFTIDLKKQTHPGETCEEALNRIGSAYCGRILGPFATGVSGE